jgi:hypothetical protein
MLFVIKRVDPYEDYRIDLTPEVGVWAMSTTSIPTYIEEVLSSLVENFITTYVQPALTNCILATYTFDHLLLH